MRSPLKLFLVESRTEMSGHIYKTQQAVPASGIYTVYHPEHRLPHDVTLFVGQIFPSCSKCGHAVRFELFREAPELDRREFRVHLHNLPALEDDTASLAS